MDELHEKDEVKNRIEFSYDEQGGEDNKFSPVLDDENEFDTEEKKRKNAFIWLLVPAIAVLIVGVIFAVKMFDRNGENDVNETNESTNAAYEEIKLGMEPIDAVSVKSREFLKNYNPGGRECVESLRGMLLLTQDNILIDDIDNDGSVAEAVYRDGDRLYFLYRQDGSSDYTLYSSDVFDSTELEDGYKELNIYANRQKDGTVFFIYIYDDSYAYFFSFNYGTEAGIKELSYRDMIIGRLAEPVWDGECMRLDRDGKYYCIGTFSDEVSGENFEVYGSIHFYSGYNLYGETGFDFIIDMYKEEYPDGDNYYYIYPLVERKYMEVKKSFNARTVSFPSSASDLEGYGDASAWGIEISINPSRVLLMGRSEKGDYLFATDSGYFVVSTELFEGDESYVGLMDGTRFDEVFELSGEVVK